MRYDAAVYWNWSEPMCLYYYDYGVVSRNAIHQRDCLRVLIMIIQAAPSLMKSKSTFPIQCSRASSFESDATEIYNFYQIIRWRSNIEIAYIAYTGNRRQLFLPPLIWNVSQFMIFLLELLGQAIGCLVRPSSSKRKIMNWETTSNSSNYN